MKLKRNMQKVLVLCLVLMLTACGGSKSVERQLDLGQKYLDDMNYDKAIAAFESAIEIEPEIVDSYVGLAKAYQGKAETLNDPEEQLGTLIMAYDTLNDMLKDTEMEYTGINENIDSVMALKSEVQSEFNDIYLDYVAELTNEGEFDKALEITLEYEDYFWDSVEEFLGTFIDDAYESEGGSGSGSGSDSESDEGFAGLFGGGDDDSDEGGESADLVTVSGMIGAIKDNGDVIFEEDYSHHWWGIYLDEPVTMPDGTQQDFLMISTNSDEVKSVDFMDWGNEVTLTGELIVFEDETIYPYNIIVNRVEY